MLTHVDFIIAYWQTFDSACHNYHNSYHLFQTTQSDQLLNKYINDNYKNILNPFWHPKIESKDMVDKHLVKVGCTNFAKVLFTNVGRTYLVKTFLDGNITLEHN
jgi:uncharacterized membrane protein